MTKRTIQGVIPATDANCEAWAKVDRFVAAALYLILRDEKRNGDKA